MNRVTYLVLLAVIYTWGVLMLFWSGQPAEARERCIRPTTGPLSIYYNTAGVNTCASTVPCP